MKTQLNNSKCDNPKCTCDPCTCDPCLCGTEASVSTCGCGCSK